MALVAAVGVIASTVASVKALVPEDKPAPRPHAKVSGLKIHRDVPLGEFVARNLPAADGEPQPQAAVYFAAELTGQGGEPAAVPAQTPSGDSGAPPPPSGAPASPQGEKAPPAPEGTDTPPAPGETGTPGAEGGQTPAGTREDGAETTPTPTPPVPPSPAPTITPPRRTSTGGGRATVLVPETDLRRSVRALKRANRRLRHRLKRRYALSGSCRKVPPARGCPLATGMKVRFPADVDASRQTKVQAGKLALIRLAMAQLRQIKSTRRPDGRRDPVGVELSYRLKVCGYDDRPVHVQWTVRDDNRPSKVSSPWWRWRPANTIRRDSPDCDVSSHRFWIPLPAAKGRFSVELTALNDRYDEQQGSVESGPFSS